MLASASAHNEFSRAIAVDRVGNRETVHRIEATAAERVALAERFELLSLDLFRATLRLGRSEGDPVIAVTGRFEADVTQVCVVSLEPARSHLSQEVALTFSLDQDEAAREVQVEIGERDPPEPIGPEGLDLGEAMVQLFAELLDPFPRAAGARLERTAWDRNEDEKTARGPFAGLEVLKRRGDSPK